MEKHEQHFVVRVIYRIAMCHSVLAESAERACEMASSAEVVGPIEVLDEVEHQVLRGAEQVFDAPFVLPFGGTPRAAPIGRSPRLLSPGSSEAINCERGLLLR